MADRSDWRPPPGSGTYRAKTRQMACREYDGHLEAHFNYCPTCGVETQRREVAHLFEEYLRDTPDQVPHNDSSDDDSS